MGTSRLSARLRLFLLVPLLAISVLSGLRSAGSQSAPSDELVIAAEGEPETLLPKDGCSVLTDLVADNVYDRLIKRNRDGTIVGQLAETFEQVDPTTWRFHLRQGVTFTNGEPFNADAVMTMVEYYMNPENAARCAADFPTLAWPAVKIDDYTVDLITTVPDPLLPIRLRRFYIVAPNWLTTTPEAEAATHAVGTGPYILEEWVQGSHVLLRVNDSYWGPDKGTVATVRIVGRPEAAVRASMLEAGEANLALMMPAELMDQVPASIRELTTESVGFRINTQQPQLSDIRVRQAIAYSINLDELRDALYPGFSTPLNGQMVRVSALGQNPDLQDYPYDLELAKQLVEEAGAVGTELEISIRAGGFPGIQELGEALAAMMSESGLVVTVKILEAGQWRDDLFATQPGQERSDMLLTAAYRALWAEAYDQVWMVPLFGLDFVHGRTSDVVWEPRDDGILYFSDVTFQTGS